MEARLVLDGVIISELMALNDSYLPVWDPVEGEYRHDDWLELYNDGDQPVSLSGWKLEDSADEWVFPESWQISPAGNPTQYEPLLTLDPGEYLVVMASGKGEDQDYVNEDGYYLDGEGYLHTNFRLSGGGEYLGLFQPLAGGGWQVVHQYDEFPEQYEDISYGIAQDIEVTHLVSSGATASYLVPSSDPGDWTAETFDDSGWAEGETGLGYSNLVPGFAVWNYKANVTVSDFSTAQQVIDNPNLRSATYRENIATINYSDGSLDRGRFVGDPEFPGFDVLPDQNDFVVRATGHVTIPAGSLQWTFGVNSDDGFQLTVPGATTLSVTNSTTAAGADSISFFGTRGTADTLGVFQFPSVGTYEIELAYYERGGGAAVEIFAAAGFQASYNSNFRLVGDVAGGGLKVESMPVESGGEGTVFGSLIGTDVGGAMEGHGSLLVRVPFEVADPAAFESLTLRMKYDDGFVAYLNGTEIARRNAPASLSWDSSAAADRTDTDAAAWQNIDVSAHLGLLHAGTNVLAIHALDYDAGGGMDDAGFLVLPELAQIRYLGLGEHYFAVATPGSENSEEYWARVEDTRFSLDRGIYEKLPDGQFYWLEIATDTPGATIRYTLDGSAPTESTGNVYTGPIPFNGTTIVRAAAFRQGYEPTNVDTQTYIFLEDVLGQSASPAGFPEYWNSEPADYEMDPDIVGSVDTETLTESLLSLPTMSLVMDLDDLFGPSGIYSNPTTDGLERAGSLEYFDPLGSGEFQIDAAVRIYGGVGREPRFKKHTFRLLFKEPYGPTRLDYPLFGEDAVDEFDTIVLRSNFNDAWVWGGANVQFIRDEFASRTQNAMGDPSKHGNFVHLYVNGVYWGLYNPTERPDQAFAADYFGGDKEDWDVVNSGQPTGESSAAAYNAFRDFADTHDLTTAADYQLFMGNNPDGTDNPAYPDYLDPYNYIDYLLLNFYIGNQDWPSHNWYAGKQDEPDSTGFKWFSWDAEWIVGMNSALTNDRTAIDTYLCKPLAELRDNPEFAMLFADLAHKNLFNDGALTPGQSIARYQELADQIESSVLAESARWGDVTGTLYTIEQWRNERDWVLNTYLPQRTAIVIQQLRNAGLYPDLDASTFRLNGSYQHGGPIRAGDVLTITAPAGTIYYTLDGTDPRQTGGAIDPNAHIYSGPITLGQSTHVKSRVCLSGQWSALDEATFYIDLAPHLRVTEIMYNPAAPSAAEIAAGFTDAELFEFIEIQNVSTTETLPLEGLRFSDGIEFTFPAMSLAPGQYAVVVRDQAAFEFRYGAGTATIAGQYTGALDNAGERIELCAPVGGPIQSFRYGDGWYDQTDGEGFSLTIRDPLGEPALWDAKEGWRASEPPGGTPGTDDAAWSPVMPGSVVINEVLAHTDDPYVDAVELYNTTSRPVDVSGWFLSDRGDNLTAYQIPSLDPIPAGGYLVLYENTHFGSAFALSESGEDVYLSSNAGGVPGGYREHVDFGASPRNIPFGLYANSAGQTDFTLLEAPTLGVENADPYLEDLVINEIMYHPGVLTPEEIAAGYGTGDFEFIEIYNASTAVSYSLEDLYLGDGVGFSFGWYDADAAGDESRTLEPGATATWNAALPAGLATYEVFARWDVLDALGRPRNLDGQAKYRITYEGGAAEVVRDQQPELDDEGPDYMDQDGWVSLGAYQFDGSGQVVLTRGTNDPDNWTIADQVKFVAQPSQHEVVVDDPLLDSWYASHGSAAVGDVLGPGQYVVVVGDYAAFDERYDVAANGIPVAGVFAGDLADNGEKVKLFRAGEADPNGFIPYYRIDYVDYDDRSPWPTEPDGGGPGLNRVSPTVYGNEPTNWLPSAARGTPGAANVDLDTTPPSVPANLAAEVTLDPDAISLGWDASHDAESYVDFYIVYRDDEFLGATEDTAFDDAAVERGVVYSYRVAAVNRDGYASLPGAPLVAAIPGILSYGVTDTTRLELTFTEPLDPATAEAEANYVFTGPPIALATLSPDGLTVTLTTAQEMIPGNAYAVTIHNLTTVSGNPVPDPLDLAFLYEPQGAGYIIREYWTGITGTAISNLTSDPRYPDSPSGSEAITSLEGPVNWANDYGTRIRGFVHPPETGQYTFWIAGDDNSQLYLSTDADPDNKVLVASVPGWSNSREWNKYAEQQSAPITLVAGRKYYIEVLQKEGTGGDNIAVRWQLPDGQWENPVDPDLPIPGIRLSPYAEDTVPPTADIVDVLPDPRLEAVSQITILFSEPVTGFDLDDLALARNGVAVPFAGGETLQSANGFSWTLGGLRGLTGQPGDYTLTLLAAGSGIHDDVGNLLVTGASESWTVLPPASVSGRYVFYNDSAFDGHTPGADEADDDARDLGKQPLCQDGPVLLAGFENVTSYSRGLNGVMIDVENLASASLVAGGDSLGSDFEFRVGNSEDPGTWRSSFDAENPAPLPQSSTVRDLGGGVSRVTLIWEDGAVRNEWLQVRVLATTATGLSADDVFYFGSLVGETGDEAAQPVVDSSDLALTCAAVDLGRLVDIGNEYDFDRNGIVNFADVIRVRNAAAEGRQLVTLNLAAAGASVALTGGGVAAAAAWEPEDLSSGPMPAAAACDAALAEAAAASDDLWLEVARWLWYYELEALQAAPDTTTAARDAAAVDLLLQTWEGVK